MPGDPANSPARSLHEQLGRFRDFRRVSNEERPQAARGNATPTEYCGARRGAGTASCEPEHPDQATVRRVHRNGALRWRGAEIDLTEALVGEPVRLIERQDGGWTGHYGSIERGIIDRRGERLRRPRKACGFVDNPDGSRTNPQARQPQQQL